MILQMRTTIWFGVILFGGLLPLLSCRLVTRELGSGAAATPSYTPMPVTLATETAAPVPLTPTSTPVPLIVETATPAPAVYEILGYTAEGHPIESWHLGTGAREVVVAGGIHGGYEWNTVLLARYLQAHYESNPQLIPAEVTLTFIHVVNPAGLERVVGTRGWFNPADVPADTDHAPGRFNGRQVDLNRNWDCVWSETAVWRQQTVSGGTAPFSEPETVALRDYFLARRPAVVIFLHSAFGAVFPGHCDGVLAAETQTFAATYATASGYALKEEFDAYTVTGDASDYLATVGIPSFAVELYTRSSTDLDINLAGMQAILALLAPPRQQ